MGSQVNAIFLDKRVAKSRSTILEETYRQLAKGGIQGLSIDEVARVSGVSKATIYRHWPSRLALVLDACSRLDYNVAVPDTGTLQGDLTRLTTDLAHQLWDSTWHTIYPSIIDASERDPEVSAMQVDLHAYVVKPYQVVLKRAVERGELQEGEPQDDLIAIIIGPLFFKRWDQKAPISEGFVRQIVEGALSAFNLHGRSVHPKR